MKNSFSLIIVFIIGATLIQLRLSYSGVNESKPLKVTTWDAFGYYMYLPGTFIYQDVTELKWVEKIDKEYQVTGGKLYQADIHTNGNYVFKYLGGVAILEMPFFFIGHAIASVTDYKADGFSAPYQYSIAFGALLYCFLALLLLRKILLRFYSDRVTAITLLLLTLATNFAQYVSIDSAQSHAYIFPLYVLVIYATIKWHENPQLKWAALIGLTIGLATISRPTEAIMLFIPLLWNTSDKTLKSEKWRLVKVNLNHVFYAVLFGFIGVIPQLIYWKVNSGSFIYDVGSKWFFLNPWFRVLFGFENGWFIYTPITVLFVLGMFFMKNLPFKKSVITFCLLNIWIIIAWSDWKYGATYSTRAMVQSYPVFALAFGAILHKIEHYRWKYFFYLIGAYFIFSNFFQIGQYNRNIIHYRDMNQAYFWRIYMNPNPTPLDMSLLDTDEVITNEDDYQKTIIAHSNQTQILAVAPGEPGIVVSTNLEDDTKGWIKIEATIKATKGHETGYLHGKILAKEILKEPRIRLRNPICKPNEFNTYMFYMEIPENTEKKDIIMLLTSSELFQAELKSFTITLLQEK